MKLKILAAALALSLLFSSNATASFFSSPVTVSTQMLELISKLSDDIGIMADRILDMAGEIGVMADRIGEMSDRIVHTEQMMADLTRDLAGVQNNATPSTVIITSTSDEALATNVLPSFNVNEQAPQMLIYVSSSATMQTDTVSVLVNNTQELAQNWDQLQTLATDNKIYIAIKTIDGNTISSLSNTLTYTTLY